MYIFAVNIEGYEHDVNLHRELPIYLPAQDFSTSPSPSEAVIGSEPTFPVYVNVQSLALFDMVQIPNADSCCELRQKMPLHMQGNNV